MTRAITQSDLRSLTDIELQVLFRIVAESVPQTRPGSPDRRKRIATLDSIAVARAQHRSRQLKLVAGI